MLEAAKYFMQSLKIMPGEREANGTELGEGWANYLYEWNNVDCYSVKIYYSCEIRQD